RVLGDGEVVEADEGGEELREDDAHLLRELVDAPLDARAEARVAAQAPGEALLAEAHVAALVLEGAVDDGDEPGVERAPVAHLVVVERRGHALEDDVEPDDAALEVARVDRLEEEVEELAVSPREEVRGEALALLGADAERREALREGLEVAGLVERLAREEGERRLVGRDADEAARDLRRDALRGEEERQVHEADLSEHPLLTEQRRRLIA